MHTTLPQGFPTNDAHEQALAYARANLTIRLNELHAEVKAHSLGVANLCGVLGKLSGWGVSDIKQLQWAGFFHDHGKYLIPTEIIMKKERLTEAEFELVKQHPSLGMRRLVEDFKQTGQKVDQVICLAALQHHEQWDGSGYPNNLEQESIHPASQLVSLADHVEALSADRCYRAKMEFEEIETIIRAGRGRTWSIQVTDLFLDNRQQFYKLLAG